MDKNLTEIALSCLRASEEGTLSFPEIVGKLIGAGFDRYSVDYCTKTTTYYTKANETVVLEMTIETSDIPEAFDSSLIQTYIREAQTNAPGYSYKSFCKKATAAGCTGYIVSFLGKRVVYFGRSGDMHIEYFPQ